MNFIKTYFIRTKTRESPKEKKIINKWNGKSSIPEKPNGNRQKLIIKAPIRHKNRANICWLNKSVFNIKYPKIGTKIIKPVFFF